MTFGRTEGSDIVIENDPMMSSCHFRFSVDADGCTIEDLESTNGTLVNGGRVRSRVLADGDSVSAGRSVFTVKVDSAEVAAAPILAPEETHFRPAAALDAPIAEEQEDRPTENTEDEADAEPGDAAASMTGGSDPDVNSPDVILQNQSPTQNSVADPADGESTLRLQVNRCPSGAWQASLTHGAAYQPINVIGLLSALCPIRLIIEFDRCQIDSSDEPTPEFPTVYGASQLVAGEQSPVVDWIAAGWGRDSIIVLFSYVGIEPLMEHFRAQLPSMPLQGEELTRPSALQVFLESGSADLVEEILVPCEAVLIESDEAGGGWRLFGRNHLIELLTMNGIDFVKEE
jgi:predicted component of type VI protein secretion system